MPSKRDLITPPLVRSGAAAVIRKTLPWHGVMTLNYHRIGDGSASLFDRGLWSATPEAFDRQLRFLKSRFDIISPRDLPDLIARKKGRHLILTFDDGYLDNFTTACPILQAHNLPATFFVTTGFIDQPRITWWDEIAWMVRTSTQKKLTLAPWIPNPVPLDEPHRERAVRTLLKTYKTLPGESTANYLNAIAHAAGTGRCPQSQASNLWMNWDMLRTMHAAGMTIGGHTVNHPILARMSPETQLAEIAGCAQRLTQELAQPMTTFSYPVGHPSAFNAITRDCLQKAGVQFAFSYYGGIARFNRWDNYDIRRLPIDHDLSFDHFRAIVMLPQVFGRPKTTS